MKTKTLLLAIFAFGIIFNAFSQMTTIELSFTAEMYGVNIPLDSIVVENQTQSGDTTLYPPDTILVLDLTSNIWNNKASGPSSFSVSPNYPNPFKEKTTFKLDLYEKEKINIIISDRFGRELMHYSNILNPGGHSFDFYNGNETFYLLTVTGRQTTRTIKMLNENRNITSGKKCKIIYKGYVDEMIVFKSNSDINDFEFEIGDELKYTAYSFFGETTIVDTPLENQNYVFQLALDYTCPGIPTVTDIDGNTYNTVFIGLRCWMAENLKTTMYRNGTAIPNVQPDNDWKDLTTGAYVWYNNDLSWKDFYGALYNWHAVVDPNGLCPTGWHVPDDDEWTAFTDFIGGIDSPHGNELKSCKQVNSPLGGECNTTSHPRWDQHNINYGTDDYSFSGIPGGYRYSEGSFDFQGMYSFWWTSSEYSPGNGRARHLSNDSGSVGVGNGHKENGFSVRCIKD